MACWKRVAIPLMFLSVGCAASGPPKGQTGPVAWEVVDAVQSWEDQGTRLRWDYVVTLHNTGSRGIYLERMEIASQGPEIFGGDGHGMAGESARAGPDHAADTLGLRRVLRVCSGHIPTVMSEGLPKFLTIHGLEDGGTPVRVQIGIRLNSSFGRRSDGKGES